MNYKETIEYLYNVAPAFEKVGAGAYKEGLSNTKALDAHFGHPHKRYKTIHIAGTNGKGSCSHTLAAILQSQGYKVGLYTSPHLIDFRERIRVNGKTIPEQRIIDFVEQERKFFEPLQPSFFELTTALALKYFEEEKVDIAVIEVGLGGRIDCTNIITPILSVITNISFDHTQFLGNTLALIAAEKAGIIKEGIPCLIGEYTADTLPVFKAAATKKNATITLAQDNPIEDNNIDFELKGLYQQRNKNTILNAVRLIREHLHISDEAVKEGMENLCQMTGLMGRWQKLQDSPLVICDTGHNLAGWQFLVPQILTTAETKEKPNTLRIVFGMVDDKDINDVMDILPQNAKYYFCQASTSRAIKPERLAELGGRRNLDSKVFNDVFTAYKQALSDSNTNDFVFVGGSNYVIGELLTELCSTTGNMA